MRARSDAGGVAQSDKKVNLGIGAYRDENGKPWVLSCIKTAEAQISADLSSNKINKEYLPMQGLQAFLDKTSEVILGKDSPLIKNKQVAVVQSLSGTGALRLCAEFLAAYNPGVTVLTPCRCPCCVRGGPLLGRDVPQSSRVHTVTSFRCWVVGLLS